MLTQNNINSNLLRNPRSVPYLNVVGISVVIMYISMHRLQNHARVIIWKFRRNQITK